MSGFKLLLSVLLVFLSLTGSLKAQNIKFEHITDEDGLPQIIDGYEVQSKSSKKVFDVLRLDAIDKFQVLKEVFENGSGFKHTELVTQIQVVLDKKYRGSKGKGVGKIKQLITESKNEGWLVQKENRQPYTLGILSV